MDENRPSTSSETGRDAATASSLADGRSHGPRIDTQAESPNDRAARGKNLPTSSPTSRRPISKRSQPSTNAVQAWRNIFSKSKSQKQRDDRRVRHRNKQNHESAKPPAVAESKDHPFEHAAHSTAAPDASGSKLGKSDLGRHVNEKRMPEWLAMLLRKHGEVCCEEVVPVLAQLLKQSSSTRYAYVCSPCVQHVSKLRREGGFCGYRNIQMLVSYIINSGATGSELFGPKFPSIFEIQDLIEQAWNSGFNSQGRVETGGVKGTRKYIGTPEAQAIFSSLQIPCPVQAFKDEDASKSRALLFTAIESYFRQGAGKDASKVSATALPPIYFQHRGHSLTIVGFEKRKNGRSNLLVFDPSYRDSSTVRSFVGKSVRHTESMADHILEPYRRGDRYLRKYAEFELLYLSDIPPTDQ